MLGVVKVGSIKLEADTKAECEEKISRKMYRISKIDILDKTTKFLFEVLWNDDAPNFQAVLVVYYSFNVSEVDERHCRICKEVHALFYCNPQYTCNECKYAAYKQRVDQKERDMKSAGKEIIRR